MQDKYLDFVGSGFGKWLSANLGLPQEVWQRLADEVDVIVDPAALVNHVLPYSELFGPNALGTAELIRIALTTRIKPFAYVSTIAVGGGQLLLQGGHNPDIPIEWYEDLFRAIKQRYPTFRLHALSPPEVIHLTRMTKLTVSEVLDRLIAAGMDSVPGGGAEILVDRVRKELHCYGKATSDEWLDVMRQAHRKGLRTTATMMYGTVETDEERLEHLFRLRNNLLRL